MDVEKLLGKLLHEVTGSGGKQFKKKKYKKYKKKQKYKGQGGYYRQESSARHTSSSSSLLHGLTSNLKSGKGLLTAIGLGVGAYEIYRSKQAQQNQTAGSGMSYGAGSPQVTPAQAVSTPPPPPPTGAQYEMEQEQDVRSNVAAQPVYPEAGEAVPVKTTLDEQEIARRLIQVMIGAAHADGTLDSEEEKAILDHLRNVELAQDEKMFLLEELHQPQSIAALTQGVEDVRLGQAMYAVAASAVVIDTESERQWFDELGRSLGLSPEICQFIEENQ